MKGLLRILVGALVAFLALAMAQQSDVFLRSWFEPRREPTLDEASQKGAIEAVHLYLTLSTHLYRSDGDPRFAERVPAAGPLVEETLADIRDLASLGIRREPVLLKFEVGDVTPAGPDRALVRTRESWITRTSTTDGSEAEPPRPQLLFATYRVARDGPQWRVEGWDPDDPPGEALPPPPPDTATGAAPRGRR